jgi:hypothetical protein
MNNSLQLHNSTLLMRHNAIIGVESTTNEMSRNLDEFSETMRKFINLTRYGQLNLLNLREAEFKFTIFRINEIEQFIKEYAQTHLEELFDEDFKNLKISHENFIEKYTRFCQILDEILKDLYQTSDESINELKNL